jgi:two-component system response regulator HydG
MSPRILIADDEPLFRQTTGELLETAGYMCTCVSTACEALEALRQDRYDLVLSDLNMPGNDQLELLSQGRAIAPGTPLIVITGVPSLPTAIQSIRLGIADYLLKPVKFQDLLSSVQRVLSHVHRPAEIAQHPDRPEKDIPRFPGLIGESPCMLEIFDIIDRVAQSDANVLITGESGTGKEIVARTIHENSARSKHAYQVIDCTAIPETLFESIMFGHIQGAFTGAIRDQEGLLSQAHSGTVFLDEIGELPKTLQAKLLRVIQEQSFLPVGGNVRKRLDTRFLCATNRDLEAEVLSGQFRRDLFYRLAVVHLVIPPLRERGDDLVLLTRHFEAALQEGVPQPRRFSESAFQRLRGYRWPGNVRELRNVVERCLALSRQSEIDLHELPKSLLASIDINADTPSKDSLTRTEIVDDAERQYFVDLLKRHGGNVTKAAQEANMSRQGLHKWLRKHKIAAAQFRF